MYEKKTMQHRDSGDPTIAARVEVSTGRKLSPARELQVAEVQLFLLLLEQRQQGQQA